MNLQGKRIILYGATGFLGRYVVQKLAQEGALITLFGRNVDHGAHLKPLGQPGQIVIKKLQNITPEALDQGMGGAFAVVNLIGILHESRGNRFEVCHTLALIAGGPEKQRAKDIINEVQRIENDG